MLIFGIKGDVGSKLKGEQVMMYAFIALAMIFLAVAIVRLSRRQNTDVDCSAQKEIPYRSLVSPQTLHNVVSVGGEEPKPLPQSNDDCSVINPSKDEIDYQCGHRGSKTYQLNMWGLESKEFKSKERCPACWIERIKKYSIRCVLCGLPIFPGEAVALYHEGNIGLRLEIGTKVEDSFLGCMRWNCCPTGVFFGGHWTEEGFRPAFENGLTTAELAFKTGKVVVGNM